MIFFLCCIAIIVLRLYAVAYQIERGVNIHTVTGLECALAATFVALCSYPKPEILILSACFMLPAVLRFVKFNPLRMRKHK